MPAVRRAISTTVNDVITEIAVHFRSRCQWFRTVHVLEQVRDWRRGTSYLLHHGIADGAWVTGVDALVTGPTWRTESAASTPTTTPHAVRIKGRALAPTAVFDTYWRFAAERQTVYLARLRHSALPWTKDEVIAAHRFTNVFRAADRVSQYLITEVHATDASAAPTDLVFRTLLFKIFWS